MAAVDHSDSVATSFDASYDERSCNLDSEKEMESNINIPETKWMPLPYQFESVVEKFQNVGLVAKKTDITKHRQRTTAQELVQNWYIIR